jgi:hypothetical protein
VLVNKFVIFGAVKADVKVLKKATKEKSRLSVIQWYGLRYVDPVHIKTSQIRNTPKKEVISH